MTSTLANPSPSGRLLAHSHQRLARGHARLTEALARRDAGRFQQALAAFKRHFVAHQIQAAVGLYAALRQLGRDDPQALHQACEARREMHRVARLVLLFAEMHLQPPPQGLDLSTAAEHTQHLGRVLARRIDQERRDLQRLAR